MKGMSGTCQQEMAVLAGPPGLFGAFGPNETNVPFLPSHFTIRAVVNTR